MTALTLQLQTLAQISVAGLLNTAAEGLAVAVLAWVILYLAGRQNSGTRFAVWFLALLSIALLPFSFHLGPTETAAAARIPASLKLSSAWAVYLFAAWAAVSGILLLRLAIGLARMRSLRRNSTPLDLAIAPSELFDTLRSANCARAIRLSVSDEINCPAAFGFFHPAIVFPSWALRDLSAQELNVILLHELAHLRRWDDWTNLLQQVVKAVLFFHPAIWWIENRLALEREMACDDMVLAQTANPKVYAASLISFAERIGAQKIGANGPAQEKKLSLTQAAAGRVRQISHRIAQILDVRRPSATRVWKPVMAAVAVSSIAAILVAPRAPRLIAFQDRAAEPRPVAASLATTQPILRQQPLNRKNLNQLASSQQAATLIPSRQTPQPTAIPASYSMPVTAMKSHAKPDRRHSPEMIQASAYAATPPQMFVVMRSTRLQSGPTVWTLCIWRVGNGSSVETEIVMGVI